MAMLNNQMVVTTTLRVTIDYYPLWRHRTGQLRVSCGGIRGLDILRGSTACAAGPAMG